MGRAKIKKKSTFIDMTAMSDVTVLLLTFFTDCGCNRDVSILALIYPASTTFTILLTKNKPLMADLGTSMSS